MNDRNARLARTIMVVTWFFMLAIIILLLLFHTKEGKHTTLTITPEVAANLRGADGKDGIVDYTKVNDMVVEEVDKQISSVPKPKDGQNGANGTDGYTPVKDVDYVDGKDGKDGVNGVDGRERLLRFNPETKSFETQLAGDEFWEVLLDVCGEFPRMCE